MCGGRKTESNSQEHQKVKLGPVGMLQGETFDSVQTFSKVAHKWNELTCR